MSVGSISQKYDAIVLGLGGVGSFALRALSCDRSAAGGLFLGIEQYCHNAKERDAGSSMGRTRIYRRAYFEHEHYVPWIDYSIKIFQEMQIQSKVKLIQECGTLIMEDSASLATNSSTTTCYPPYISASMESAQIHNVPVEYYDSNELPIRFPQFRNNPSHKVVGVYEPGGGFLRPERCINVALDQSRQPTNGATVDIIDNSVVTRIENIKDGSVGPIEVHIKQKQKNKEDNNNIGNNDEIIVATTDCLLIAAGSWIGQLIPEWKSHLNVVRQIQTWIDVSAAGRNNNKNNNIDHCDEILEKQRIQMFSYENMPGFVLSTPDYPLHAFYGLPCDSDADDNDDVTTPSSAKTWLKCGLHKQTGADIFLNNNPSIIRQKASDTEIREMKDAIVRGINPLAWNSNSSSRTGTTIISNHPSVALPDFIDIQPCMYTMSPDKHYIIGQPKGYHSSRSRTTNNSNRIFVIAGLSGHGFKCVPALGQMMADFALGTDMHEWRTEFCSPSRFNI